MVSNVVVTAFSCHNNAIDNKKQLYQQSYHVPISILKCSTFTVVQTHSKGQSTVAKVAQLNEFCINCVIQRRSKILSIF